MSTYTIQKVLADAQHKLAAVSDAPDLDAERLLLFVLKKDDSSWLYTHNDAEITINEYQQLNEYIDQRMTGKPLAYIIGNAEFYGRTFIVDDRVLIPRPETEALIRHAITFTKQHPQPMVIADIGTGSGCIAITLALEIPNATIIATDISADALIVARKNARQHGVEKRIEFIEGDMLDPVAGRHINLIVSNPPYVPSAEVSSVKNTSETYGLAYEPQLALNGGPDGKKFITTLQDSGIPAILETIGGKALLTHA